MPSPNDLFVNAMEVVLPTNGATYTSPEVNNAGNLSPTSGPGAPHGESDNFTSEPGTAWSNQLSAWWVYRPLASGVATFDSIGSYNPQNPTASADTQIAVYRQDADDANKFYGLVAIASDQDSGGSRGGKNFTSWLQVPVEAGKTYYFQIGTYGSDPANLIYVARVKGPATVLQTGYAREILADNPYFYYRLNESSFNIAVDSSTNGRDASHIGSTLVNQPGLLTNDTNRAAKNVQLSAMPMGVLNTFTYTQLFKPDNPVDNPYFFSRDANSGQDLYALRREGDKVAVYVKNASFLYQDVKIGPLVVGKRYHIALRLTITNVKLALYDLDAKAMVQEAEFTINGGLRTGITPPWNMGYAPWLQSAVQGTWDEIALFPTILPDARLALQRTLAAVGPETVPKLYLGPSKVDKLKLGTADVTKAYLGSTKF